MPTLNQIIALASNQRTRTRENVTSIYKQLQKPTLFDGHVRTYHPSRQDEPELPPESKRIQCHWRERVTAAVKQWSKLLDITATQDTANCEAVADVKIADKVILRAQPVTHLLFLEKHLVDVRSVMTAIPELEQAETWKHDTNRGCHVTAPQRKTRTRKVPKVLLHSEATEHHPAKTERYDVDEVVGEYQTVLMSGKIPVDTKKEMLDRLDQLIAAVKLAREQANTIKTTRREVAKPLFDWVLEGKASADGA